MQRSGGVKGGRGCRVLMGMLRSEQGLHLRGEIAHIRKCRPLESRSLLYVSDVYFMKETRLPEQHHSQHAEGDVLYTPSRFDHIPKTSHVRKRTPFVGIYQLRQSAEALGAV